MNEQGIIIPNLALAGYRSFSKELQYFDQFTKINLFIGKNNAGKSNVLRFLSDIYHKASLILKNNEQRDRTIPFSDLDRYLPGTPDFMLGIGERIDTNELPLSHRLNIPIFNIEGMEKQDFVSKSCFNILKEKAKTENTTPICWTIFDSKYVTGKDKWSDAVRNINYRDNVKLFELVRSVYRSYRDPKREELESEIIKKILLYPVPIKAKLIPAIRRIGEKDSSADAGSSADTFDGTGIIDRLARLQNPDVHSQNKRERFNEITNFFRDVVDRPDAVLEIPYERDTILVHMDGRVLPIESLGTGIHEVVILAAAATVLSEHVVCIEEPELHLNPILQRKLIRYLSAHTNNQYFITTHSAVLMDVPDAEIYHIKLVNGASVVERVTSGRQRSAVCEDLGYHPSDLFQANCIVWVEGPSDRIYLNWWLKSMAQDLVEGIQYSIMFYGGRLLSHLSNDDVEETDVNDFISLRKLNNRSVMLIDSDKENEDSDINATKSRLRDEFNSGPGHAWITEGREIENYLPAAWIEAAIKEIHPQAKKIGPFEKYDNTLKITGGKGKETQADKVKVARHITEQSQLDLSMYDLKAQLNKLIKFIRESNPAPASSEKKQRVPASP